MKKVKKQKSQNTHWLCSCGEVLGKFLRNNMIEIRGPLGQEYEVSFSSIGVICPKCKKKCYIESEDFKNLQKSFEDSKENKELTELTIKSGEAETRINLFRSLDGIGLESFYSLEDRYKKILKGKLSEWQKKIYDCLCSLELEANVSNEEEWNKIVKVISEKLGASTSKVERDIFIIGKEIKEILVGG